MAEWVKIQEFNLVQDAYMAKSLLENEEIQVFLKDEVSTQVFSMFSAVIGGVKLLVPETDAERAITILKEGGYIDA